MYSTTAVSEFQPLIDDTMAEVRPIYQKALHTGMNYGMSWLIEQLKGKEATQTQTKEEMDAKMRKALGPDQQKVADKISQLESFLLGVNKAIAKYGPNDPRGIKKEVVKNTPSLTEEQKKAIKAAKIHIKHKEQRFFGLNQAAMSMSYGHPLVSPPPVRMRPLPLRRLPRLRQRKHHFNKKNERLLHKRLHKRRKIHW